MDISNEELADKLRLVIAAFEIVQVAKKTDPNFDAQRMDNVIEFVREAATRLRSNDSERLDWLESQALVEISAWPGDTTLRFQWSDSVAVSIRSAATLRDAIDSAMSNGGDA